MKPIIPPVDQELIEKELTNDKFLRYTNNGNNILFIITHIDSPNVMQEIGRLRELTFRAAGGGTGKEADIDSYDISDDPYKQLIVWDPNKREILGGYRFYTCTEGKPDADGNYNLATSRLFHFSEKFKQEYVPWIVELGRSFVQPAYQSTGRNSKGIYALDNLWDGLGAIKVNNPSVKYFFGKVTMYTNYNPDARNLILYFLEKHFPDPDHLLTPLEPLDTGMDRKKLGKLLSSKKYKDDYKLLSKHIRKLGEIIPPLINSYMNLSPSMKSFGTVLNTHFGNVEETAILVSLNDLYETKVNRHITTYVANRHVE
jgi:hypothetical protein